MNNSEKRAKLVSSAIAKARVNLKQFTIVQLVFELKNVGCPYAVYVPTILRLKGLILKSEEVYTFAISDPIHFKVLQNELDGVVSTTSKYVTKCRDKKLGIVPENVVVLTDDEMIIILKRKGFKILRPITNYEEI